MPRTRSEKTVANWRNRCRRAAADPTPLRVTAHLGAPLAGRTPHVQLDAVLSLAAAHRAHYPSARRPVAPVSTDRDIEAIAIPCAHDGRVWCASALSPAEPVDSPAGRVHWRMRPAMEYAHLISARQVTIKHGRTRAHQGEITLWSVERLTAYLLGDADLVAALLRHVPSVGSDRSSGYGRVVRWEVDEDHAAASGWRVTPGGRMARAYPHPSGRPLGVRPPYWYRPWWTPALTPGDPDPGDLPAGPADHPDAFFVEAGVA